MTAHFSPVNRRLIPHSDKNFIVSDSIHKRNVGTYRASPTCNSYDNWHLRVDRCNDNSLREFFLKPKLEFATITRHILNDTRWGELSENGESFYPNRLFIYVKVRNNANRAATNCEVRLNVKNKTNGCDWLSTNDTKTLLWTNGKSETSIKNKPAEREFCLAFSQERLTQKTIEMIGPVYCGVKREKTKCVGWVGTERALQRTGYADPDGMCPGNFVVHVDVVMDYGKTIGRDFKIMVGNTWRDLNAEMLSDKISKSQRAKASISHTYNRLIRRQASKQEPKH